MIDNDSKSLVSFNLKNEREGEGEGEREEMKRERNLRNRFQHSRDSY